MEVRYHELGHDAAADRGRSLGDILACDLAAARPEQVVLVEPGDWRVRRRLEEVTAAAGARLDVRADAHFYCSTDEFGAWARERRSLVLETFYRRMRRTHGVLLTSDGKPVGGVWNYDRENRASFGRIGPESIRPPRAFRPDARTRAVVAMVEARFGDHPGTLDALDLPITRRQALAALDDFIEHRLPTFGTHQDAMWTGEPYLSHARLSVPLNLHLLRPRECVQRAVAAYESGHAPLASVEGFVRQILGWREFVRGIYWMHMPGYAEMNALACGEDVDVPSSFWSGETEMRCVREVMGQVLRYGYAHHIQRLMVLGLYAQLLGVHPRRFSDWHMAMYLDAIDWVSLPNALGMSQYGDGGIVGTKPYCASGAYIDRMSDYCSTCRFDPRKATGANACPMTTLYWDFLDRHRERLRGNRRMQFQMANLERRRGGREMQDIRCRARVLRTEMEKPTARRAPRAE